MSEDNRGLGGFLQQKGLFNGVFMLSLTFCIVQVIVYVLVQGLWDWLDLLAKHVGISGSKKPGCQGALANVKQLAFPKRYKRQQEKNKFSCQMALPVTSVTQAGLDSY